MSAAPVAMRVRGRRTSSTRTARTYVLTHARERVGTRGAPPSAGKTGRLLALRQPAAIRAKRAHTGTREDDVTCVRTASRCHRRHWRRWQQQRRAARTTRTYDVRDPGVQDAPRRDDDDARNGGRSVRRAAAAARTQHNRGDGDGGSRFLPLRANRWSHKRFHSPLFPAGLAVSEEFPRRAST